MLLKGYLSLPGGGEVEEPTVEVTNLDTGDVWQATTLGSYYHLDLTIDEDIAVGDTLRIIARDTHHNVNMTEYPVTIDDINAGMIHCDLLLDVHYRDIIDFPYYEAEDQTGGGYSFNQLCGAAVGKMFTDYLSWNITADPSGPPDLLSQTDIYEMFTSYQVPAEWLDVGLNYLDTGDYITAFQLLMGVIDNVEGSYSFNLHRFTDPDYALASLCGLIDLPLGPYVGPDYPPYSPAAIPFYGNYSNWVAVRGVHTNMDAYENRERIFPGLGGSLDNLTVYGFWINDPYPASEGGVGENTYKTAENLKSHYFKQLILPGDPLENNTYLIFVEPPEDIDEGMFTEVPEISNLVFAEPTTPYTPGELLLAESGLAKVIQYQQAFDGAQAILQYSGEDLTHYTPHNIVTVATITGERYSLVIFDNLKTGKTLVVNLGSDGCINELSLSGYAPEYMEGISRAVFTEGSTFFPQEII
jgi:hypothetical protein